MMLHQKLRDIGISCQQSATDVAKRFGWYHINEKELLLVLKKDYPGRKNLLIQMKYANVWAWVQIFNMFSVAVATAVLLFTNASGPNIDFNNFYMTHLKSQYHWINVDESYLLKPQRWDLKLIYKYMVIYAFLPVLFSICWLLVVI